MKQFTLNLLENFNKPFVYLENFFKIRALLDTGADFPVWTVDEIFLKKIGGVKINSNVSFGGFGGKTTGNLYKMKYFQLGDLIFPEMHIVAKKLNLPCQMILSAPMFHDLIYEIDNVHHKLNITISDGKSNIKNLIIYNKEGKMYVACSDSDENFKVIVN